MILNYEELREALGIDKKITNVRYIHIGKKECVQIILEGEDNIIKKRTEYVYHCKTCDTTFKEPGMLVNPSCRNCGSEWVELDKATGV